MKREIYRIIDPAECVDIKTGESVSYLTYDGKVYGDAKIIDVGAKDATLEELVGLCDYDAENCNAHEFCGVHRLLGRILFEKCGRTHATELMREIALFGGLHGMNGVNTNGNAYTDLKVGKIGHMWNGTYD